MTDRLSDYYRKFRSLTAHYPILEDDPVAHSVKTKAPPDTGGARNAHVKAPGQRVPFSIYAPFSE